TFVFAMTHALAEGLQRAKQPLATLGGSVSDILNLALAAAANNNLGETQRVQAIQLLPYTTYEASGQLLLGFLDLRQPQPVQLAALNSLARFTNSLIGGELTRRWNNLTPRLRAEALTVLL